MLLGEKIRLLRTEKGYSLRELGKRVNLSFSYLGDIERGRTNPSIETLKSLAEALEVPVTYFLEENNNNSPPRI